MAREYARTLRPMQSAKQVIFTSGVVSYIKYCIYCIDIWENFSPLSRY